MSWYLGNDRRADKMAAAWIIGFATICAAVGVNSLGFWGIFVGPIIGVAIVSPYLLLGWAITKIRKK